MNVNPFLKLRRECLKGLSRASLKTGSITVNGKKVCLPLIDGVGASNLVIRDGWMWHFVSEASREKDGYFLDVGANVGLFLIMTYLQGAKNPYIGVDPNPLCVHYVNELIRLNRMADATTYCLALGDRMRPVRLHAARKADKMGSIYGNARSEQDRRESFSYNVLMMNALDFLSLSKIDNIAAIKIDVEGAESLILESLTPFLKAKFPWIFCEILPRTILPRGGRGCQINSADHVFDLLSSAGYVVMNRHGDAALKKIKEGGNFVFLPKHEANKFK